MTAGNLVDASGYKYSEKDTKPGKIKLRKSGAGTAKGRKKNDGIFSLLAHFPFLSCWV